MNKRVGEMWRARGCCMRETGGEGREDVDSQKLVRNEDAREELGE